MSKAQLNNKFPAYLSQRALGFIYALTACALFSLKPVLIKLAYLYGGSATSIMALRAFCSLPIYVVTLILILRSAQSRAVTKRYGLLAICIGILGYYLASLLDILSLQDISAQLERLLLFLYPTIVVFIVWGITKQRPNNKTLVSALVGYIGVAIIFLNDFQHGGEKVLVGSSLVLASAIAFAFYVVLSKTIIIKMGSSLFTSIAMASAGVVILVQLIATEDSVSNWGLPLIFVGIVLGLVCTVIPSYLMSAALALLSPCLLIRSPLRMLGHFWQ